MKRHTFSMTSFIAGIYFMVLGIVLMLNEINNIQLDMQWIPAIALLVVASVGIASAVRGAFKLRIRDNTPSDIVG